MDKRITKRRLTICGDLSVYEEVVVEPVAESTRYNSPFPIAMADHCAVIISALIKSVQRSESAGYTHTVSMIKAVRALTGCGLKEAKFACERSET